MASRNRTWNGSVFVFALSFCVFSLLAPWLSSRQAAQAQGLCWDVRCGRHVTCGSNECAASSSGSSYSSGGRSYRKTTRTRKRTYRKRRKRPSKAQIRRRRAAAANLTRNKKMLRHNNAGLAHDRAENYAAAIREYEIALGLCKRKKSCDTIRKNLSISRSDKWDKEYKQKRKREEAELKKKKAAAKAQVGRMLGGLGENWGGARGGATSGGPSGLGFGPVKTTSQAGRSGPAGLGFGPPGTAGGPGKTGGPGQAKQPEQAGPSGTEDILARLRADNMGAMTALQPPGARAKDPKARKSKAGSRGKPGEDLRTTTFHGRAAKMIGGGAAAKKEAMRGFDTTGAKMVPLNTKTVDLRGRPLKGAGDIPKDIGAIIPAGKTAKVTAALSADPSWLKLKIKREKVEKRQIDIKTKRLQLQTDFANAASDAARKAARQKIIKSYQEEKAARDALFDVKVEQKNRAENVAKTVEIEIVGGDDPAPAEDIAGSGEEGKASEEAPVEAAQK